MPLSHNLLTDNDRFHRVRPDYPERSINTALENGTITHHDAKLIMAFVSERQITSGIGVKRVVKWTSQLISCRRFVGPYLENTIGDIYQGIRSLQSGVSTKGKPYSASTISDLIFMIKTFYLWLIENDYVDIPEKKIRAIKRPAVSSTRTAADMLTPDEVSELLSGCRTSRDRAMIMTMYEGGFRVGEIGEMKWKDVKLDGTGAVISVNFKTGKSRYIRLVLALEYLIKWRSDYHGTPEGENFVFLQVCGRPLTYQGVVKQLERIIKRTSIQKKITPHILRHSRTTHLIQQGVSESVIKLILWGDVGSQMLSKYAHLTGEDIDNEIFQLYGIDPKISQTDEKHLVPKVCPHCHEINAPISKYCHICSHPLDDHELTTTEAFQEWVLKNSDLLSEFLHEKKLSGAPSEIPHFSEPL